MLRQKIGTCTILAQAHGCRSEIHAQSDRHVPMFRPMFKHDSNAHANSNNPYDPL